MGGVCRTLDVVINAMEAYYLASAPSAVTVCVISLCTMVGFYSTFRAGIWATLVGYMSDSGGYRGYSGGYRGYSGGYMDHSGGYMSYSGVYGPLMGVYGPLRRKI